MTGSGAGHVEDNDTVGGLNEVFLFPHRNVVIKNMLMSQTKKKVIKSFILELDQDLNVFTANPFIFLSYN